MYKTICKLVWGEGVGRHRISRYKDFKSSNI